MFPFPLTADYCRTLYLLPFVTERKKKGKNNRKEREGRGEGGGQAGRRCQSFFPVVALLGTISVYRSLKLRKRKKREEGRIQGGKRKERGVNGSNCLLLTLSIV